MLLLLVSLVLLVLVQLVLVGACSLVLHEMRHVACETHGSVQP
jgi:hypothetical protein